MTTATVSTIPSGSRGIDRAALRIGTALVLWAARHAERRVLTQEQRDHRIALEQLQLDRDIQSSSAMLAR